MSYDEYEERDNFSFSMSADDEEEPLEGGDLGPIDTGEEDTDPQSHYS